MSALGELERAILGLLSGAGTSGLRVLASPRHAGSAVAPGAGPLACPALAATQGLLLLNAMVRAAGPALGHMATAARSLEFLLGLESCLVRQPLLGRLYDEYLSLPGNGLAPGVASLLEGITDQPLIERLQIHFGLER
ncbi:hypothetical protein H696_04104 [Fonticula alba]|uniref:Uncharacterized protein n=1 Tax=Fonticula alba TaxID=691883 RepID=A0A058Z842_FONAL|nr:hypothetical protein H696_04104 [Fonticula alba]KCV69697.1 hypothetical protein H696_04104 [Fonticula alba]|eukprot:XP_009496262.1 hypothetical protein H696_04104 [Fonticula alba]